NDDLEVMHQLADQLVREADRLGRIVDDLLDLSLIEAQEAPIRDRVLVRVLLDEAADRLAPMALATGIPLRVLAVEDGLPGRGGHREVRRLAPRARAARRDAAAHVGHRRVS